MKNIGFIGAGNMATAMIGGIVKAKMEALISVYDIDQAKIDNLKKQYQIKPCSSVTDLVKEVDYLVLAIKPQNFAEVLADIKQSINTDTVIISIAAGISDIYISSQLGISAKVAQVMPNTPLLLGYGATAVSRNSNVNDQEFECVQQIFNCAGISAVVPKDKMNEIIPINGSSPAFIYEFARCFIEYGKSVGLDEKVCLDLFSQTLIGSAKMMMESGYTVEELIEMVSSKGGTTIAGLNAFQETKLQASVQNACEKCVNRAYELSK